MKLNNIVEGLKDIKIDTEKAVIKQHPSSQVYSVFVKEPTRIPKS